MSTNCPTCWFCLPAIEESSRYAAPGTASRQLRWWSAGLALLATLLLAGLVVGSPWSGRCLAADRFEQVDVREVTVGGEIGRRIDMTVKNNLMQLDLDGQFLKPFEEKNRAGGYVGLGKTIDAFTRLAAYTGDAQLRARKDHLVAAAIAAQEPDGYLGIMRADSRVFTLWDIHEMGYLVYGLVTDYQYFGNEKSLAAARKLADYIISRWTAEPDREPGGGSITVHMAVTGVESAMLALYAQTKDRRYLDFCTRFRKLPEWDARIVLGRWGQIEGHAYSHMCRCIAQLRLYRLQSDEQLLCPAHEVIDFLVRRNGLVVTGACGDHECWHDTQEGTINLGETCATAYLIRMLDELFRMEGNTLYADMMERSIYNALFAAQSPDGRRIRYYTPFDGPRKYHSGDTYCCPSNYRRIVAELPSMIYYKAADGLVVNLYTESTLRTRLADGTAVLVQQQTHYPRDQRVLIKIVAREPHQFAVYLRLPRWCNAPEVRINGQAIADAGVRPGNLFRIHRTWQPGDLVELCLPMEFRLVKGRVAQAGRVAVMRGPLVFCLNRARNPELADVDLRLVVIKPESLSDPEPDDTLVAGGLACRIQAWKPGSWYPMAEPELSLLLTEYPDPGGEAIYFKVPNPRSEQLVDDELCQPIGAGPKPPAR